MTELPYEHILNREEAIQNVENNFQDAMSLLEELTNYGTNLIPRCITSSERKFEDMIILNVLLKQVIAMLDGVTVCLRQGSQLAASVISRSLLEALFNLLWVMDSDTETRAKQFYVWHLRQARDWALRTIPGTPEYNEFRTQTSSYSFIDSIEDNQQQQDAKNTLREIKRLLNSPAYKVINDSFDRLRGNKKYDVKWFVPSGPSSIKDKANRLGLSAEYALFYRDFSKVTHGLGIERHVKITQGKIIIEPIRKIDQMRPLCRFTVAIALIAYRTILQKYRAEELPRFGRKYVEEWRQRFQDIPDVSYKEAEDYIEI